MSGQQVIFGLLEFLISIFVSFILIFGSYKLFLIITPKFDEERQLKKKNTSIGIILGSILIGETIVVKQSIYPVMAVIQLFILGGKRNMMEFLKTMGLGVGYIVLAGILALGCILFSFWLFNILTPRINQYEEIKNNNIAVALFMALFVIAISLLISIGVAGLTRALIPFPKVGTGPLL
jgi:putative membrane protein